MFIDELHTLVGAGAAEGAIDASNLLKPALARGELRAIGATTLREYQKYIERDPALERRFQPIYVAEPSIEDTILILRGIKEKYELHHGVKIKDSALAAAANLAARYVSDRFLPDEAFHRVKIPDDAIEAAVKLSKRYVGDRYLPDKAVDLVDEAMSSLRLDMESEPDTLGVLKHEIQKLQIEREALKNEKGKAPQLKALDRSLADLKEKAKTIETKWLAEKEVVNNIKELKKSVDEARFQVEKEQAAGNLQRVAELKYGQLPDFMKKLRAEERKLSRYQKSRPILKEEVTEEDVAHVVSRWTGIPVTRLIEEEANAPKPAAYP